MSLDHARSEERRWRGWELSQPSAYSRLRASHAPAKDSGRHFRHCRIGLLREGIDLHSAPQQIDRPVDKLRASHPLPQAAFKLLHSSGSPALRRSHRIPRFTDRRPPSQPDQVLPPALPNQAGSAVSFGNRLRRPNRTPSLALAGHSSVFARQPKAALPLGASLPQGRWRGYGLGDFSTSLRRSSASSSSSFKSAM